MTTLRVGLIPAALLLSILLATPMRLPDLLEPSSTSRFERTAVEVRVEDGHGSGVVVRRGLVLTAAHVVAGATDITVVFHDGTSQPARLAWVSEGADVAALLTETAGAPAAALACRAPAVGEPVITIGYPADLRGARSWGHVAALRTDERGPATVALDITAYAGSSGGPVFDADGRLLGMIHSIMGIRTIPTGMPAPVGYALMVPASTLCELSF